MGLPFITTSVAARTHAHQSVCVQWSTQTVHDYARTHRHLLLYLPPKHVRAVNYCHEASQCLADTAAATVACVCSGHSHGNQLQTRYYHGSHDHTHRHHGVSLYYTCAGFCLSLHHPLWLSVQ